MGLKMKVKERVNLTEILKRKIRGEEKLGRGCRHCGPPGEDEIVYIHLSSDKLVALNSYASCNTNTSRRFLVAPINS